MTDEKKYCPRAIEEGKGPNSVFKAPFNGEMEWREQPTPDAVLKVRTCSYCGSLHPDDLFALITIGLELGPTDKSYKMYVSGSGFWGKFYFQHFDENHRVKFVDALNDASTKIGVPGHFYTMPYFLKRKE